MQLISGYRVTLNTFYKGERSTTIIGTFRPEDYNKAGLAFDTVMLYLVHHYFPNITFDVNSKEFSSLYSKMLDETSSNKKVPYRYVFLSKITDRYY